MNLDLHLNQLLGTTESDFALVMVQPAETIEQARARALSGAFLAPGARVMFINFKLPLGATWAASDAPPATPSDVPANPNDEAVGVVSLREPPMPRGPDSPVWSPFDWYRSKVQQRPQFALSDGWIFP